MVNREQLVNILNSVLEAKSLMVQRHRCNLWFILCPNPFLFVREADVHVIADALIDVYSSVPAPIVDYNNDGIDDNLQVRPGGCGEA